ncbi:phosphotransferase family protein [Streptomyces specialis]|uniref:phosphotransferase family protein n=1 Tax=Streptomyces specialis TaxID=498367 RepID=UPI00073F9884|nr:aminoglycoside phosphotransferase family protein [Streptomyces specialis]
MASGCAEEAAWAVLTEACRVVGLDPAGAALLRLGSNGVFRLASSPVIVRIAQNPESAGELERAVRVARWLATEDFPAARVLPGVRQPAAFGGRVVTFWENAQDRVEYARLDELADLLQRLHRLEVPETLGLPYFDPFARIRDALRALDGIADDDRQFLDQRAAKLQEEYGRLDFVLPSGVIHGDANVGNALRHRNGHAILIDLDGFSLAPREWDLVLTAMYYERYGWHTKAEYESFVHHYGFELMNWPGYPALADVRELMMTLWLGTRTSNDPKAAEEFARRVRALRDGGSRRDWQPF